MNATTTSHGCCCSGKAAAEPRPTAARQEPAATVVDPVCGMTIAPSEAAGSYEHDGVTYYFCNPSCLARFSAAPEAFLGPKPPAPPAPEGTDYICPMHPEVRQDHPGACPICGMALEPRTVTLDEAPNPELVDMTRRLWIAAALAFPVFASAMGDMVLGMGLGGRVDAGLANWIGLALATPVVFWAGWPFFERAWASLVNRSPNMFTLDRHGRGGGVRVQRGRDPGAGPLPGGLPQSTGWWRRTSTPPW